MGPICAHVPTRVTEHLTELRHYGTVVRPLPLLSLIQSGQLNEYTERKEMSADVVCMSLGTVPPGEQRSRFLAVGLADQTVRIISLDPSVSLVEFSLALPVHFD